MALHYKSDVTWCELLKKRREELNMTRADMARVLKVSPTTLHKYETGKASPAIHHCVAIADVLGMDLIDFITTVKESGVGEKLSVVLYVDIKRINRSGFKKVQCGKIIVSLRQSEKNRKVICVKYDGRMMLFAERKKGVPSGEYIELKSRPGNEVSLRFFGVHEIASKEVVSESIFAQYKRDLKDYIFKNDTKTSDGYCIVNEYLL